MAFLVGILFTMENSLHSCYSATQLSGTHIAHVIGNTLYFPIISIISFFIFRFIFERFSATDCQESRGVYARSVERKTAIIVSEVVPSMVILVYTWCVPPCVSGRLAGRLVGRSAGRSFIEWDMRCFSANKFPTKHEQCWWTLAHQQHWKLKCLAIYRTTFRNLPIIR